jgi:hypothetical protein
MLLMHLPKANIQVTEVMRMEDHKELLTTLNVGQLVGLGPDAVLAAIKRGDLPYAARTPRGTYLVTRQAAESFKRTRDEGRAESRGSEQ